ncbi:MAG TPA: ATP-binding cassette domain-containing protein [Acidobacteriaceae bacterium]
MPPAIEYRDVSLTTGGRAILDHVHLALESGTTTAILGRSGSGKTTLLRMVNRLISPTTGRVLVNGRDVAMGDLIGLRRTIGYVIQEAGLFPHLTIARNVMMVPELAGGARAGFAPRVEELLGMVGLDAAQFAGRHPAQLSGGQRQRVGFARALAADPPLLLMDEPFGALDPLTRAEMQGMLRALLARLCEEGRQKTVLLVTHDLDEALFLASRIVLVESGRVVADLAPQQFLHSAEPAVEAYVRAFHRAEKARA